MTKIIIDIELCIDCPYSRTDEDDSSVLICDSEKIRIYDKYNAKVPENCSRVLQIAGACKTCRHKTGFPNTHPCTKCAHNSHWEPDANAISTRINGTAKTNP
jgi:hypothetical protein